MSAIDTLRAHPRRTLVVLGYAVVVFVASVLPAASGSLTPTGPLGVVGLDKWIHAVGYAGLGFGVAYALQARGVTESGTAVVVAAVFGACIELVQALLPYRSFSLLDMGANLFGAFVGGVLWYAVTRLQTGR
ncbi:MULTISPECIES: VanZ family protein [Haloferax]|uniref:Antibiotic resistance protein VanZ n=1 Tax=Haloferax marinum TaxID=2666143 RepID=A0A6A8G4Z0_9EURY|nr:MULTISPECIES: VanZ family protein [Haloferax]KAB1197263.1 antibiotic resistance protein VanZ [Haloferax sp. CBA1150]MRW96300.1 antibiotic resistance protein VanZ [Haloferax marinum]